MNEDHPLNVLHEQTEEGIERKNILRDPSDEPLDVPPSEPHVSPQEAIQSVLPKGLQSVTEAKADLEIDTLPKTEPQEQVSPEPRIQAKPEPMASPLSPAPRPIEREPVAEEQTIDKRIPEKVKGYVQKPIRTYEGDIADIMAQKKASVTTIAIAENKKRTGSEEISDKPKRNYTKQIVMGVVSVVLIGGGIVGGYYFYEQSPLSAPTPAPALPAIVSLVPSDKQEVINIGSNEGKVLIAQINSEFKRNSLGQGKIFELILGQKNGETSSRVTGSSFVQKANLLMPDLLQRSLTDHYMLGTYGEETGENTPFLILTTDFFQNAFAGMLSWESSMPDNLASLLDYEAKARAGDDTASTSIASFFGIRGKFVDKEIQNRDVREFISSQNEPLFLYSFIDKNTLIITTTESALTGILGRIDKQTYVR